MHKQQYRFVGKRDGLTEQCQYCGATYHPMTRYTRGDELIFVCDMRFERNSKGELVISDSDCPQKAAAEGWQRRDDLTPTR